MARIFKENTRFKAFFLSLLLSAIGFGLYKGVIDNYLAEVVHINELERGLTEFFRELPGLLLVVILALFYRFSAVLGLCNSAYAATIKLKTSTR